MIITEFMIIYLLIFVRFSTAIMFLPLFTNATPIRVKVLFSAIMSFVFFTMGQYKIVPISNFVDISASILFEMVNGFLLGFVVIAILNAIYLAGNIIDMNIGFSMINAISPTNEEEMPVTANMFYMLSMIVFFLTNSHHKLIEGFSVSLNKIPLGVLSFSPLHVITYKALIGETFLIGVRIALPILITIFVSDLILGVLSKAMPGMNVFVIGMPFKILIGLSTLLIILPAIIQMLMFLIDRFYVYLDTLLNIGI